MRARKGAVAAAGGAGRLLLSRLFIFRIAELHLPGVSKVREHLAMARPFTRLFTWD